jgi:hypothetical protein
MLERKTTRRGLMWWAAVTAASTVIPEVLNINNANAQGERDYHNPSVEEVLAMRPEAYMLINTPGFIEPEVGKDELIKGMTEIVTRMGTLTDTYQYFEPEAISARNRERAEMIKLLVEKTWDSPNGITPLMALALALSENGGTLMPESSQLGPFSDIMGAGVGCEQNGGMVGLQSFGEELDSVTGVHPNCSIVTFKFPGEIALMQYSPEWPGEYLAVYGGSPIWGALTIACHRALIETLGKEAHQYDLNRGNYYDLTKMCLPSNTVAMLMLMLDGQGDQEFWQAVLANAQ